jgi:hypothetical protein
MEFLLKENLQLISAPIPSVDFNGTWKNQLGSEMKIEVLPTGQINGKYKTAVGDPSNLEEFDLTGTVTGDLISFIVNFGKYGSLTAWTGQHTIDNSKEKIVTLWHLAKNFQDSEEPQKLWSGLWTGADNFFKI